MNRMFKLPRLAIFQSLLILFAYILVPNRAVSGDGQMIGQTLPASDSLRNTAYHTRPGEETRIGFGGAALIPELAEFRRLASFLRNWWCALQTNDLQNSKLLIGANTMLPKELETPHRMDLKSWLLTLLMQGSDGIQVCDPPVSKEERSLFSGSDAILLPEWQVEAEIAAYDEATFSKQTGFRFDLMLGSDDMTGTTSMRHEQSREISILVVTARVKHRSSGEYQPGASAVVGATLVEKAKNLDLGLYFRGSGIGYGNHVKVRPALQQTMLRCASRAVMVALARAVNAPYWKVLPHVAEDETVKAGFRNYLASQTPGNNAIVRRQIEAVLDDPFREPQAFRRQDVLAISGMIGEPADRSGWNAREMRRVPANDIVIEFRGFSPTQRIQLAAIAGVGMERALVWHSSDWIYTATPKPKFQQASYRRAWAERVCESIPDFTGFPCQVFEISPRNFIVQNASEY